ncbi:MAG: hypothetical protein H8E87_00620 [FCB group bacterium]|nr:hypothetical protein [FCB group bacterium]
MAKKQKRRVVIGIHIEGSTVYLAKVRYSGGNYQLLDVQRAQLPQSAITDDSRPVLEGIEAGGINLDVESMDITIPPETEESPSGSLEFKIDESASLEDTPLVMRMFRDYRDLRYKVSAALSEPDVFYVHFGSNWGLKGKKLRGKVLQELSQIKTEKKKLKPEDYDIISMPNEQLTAVTRDKNIPLLDMIHEQKRRRRIPMPRIGCVETLETALTNLTIQFCELKEDELTVIVYIGSEHSRFIFLQGSRLMYISQQIHDGGYSKQIANILYSRLLFELDNLNIEGLNRIIICGKTKSSNVIDYMREAFAEESSVEEMDFSGIDTSGLSPEDIANLPEYAGAIGAALRLMLPENPDLIRIDITPAFIKAGQ